MRMFQAFVLAVVLAGCASMGTSWYKPGATQDDFYTDEGQCKAQAFSVANGNMYQIAIVLHSCLQGKGWRQVRNS